MKFAPDFGLEFDWLLYQIKIAPTSGWTGRRPLDHVMAPCFNGSLNIEILLILSKLAIKYVLNRVLFTNKLIEAR